MRREVPGQGIRSEVPGLGTCDLVRQEHTAALRNPQLSFGAFCPAPVPATPLGKPVVASLPVQVQRRAMDAIARSAHITAAGEVRSRSPSASPPYHRSRSPSSAYGHGAGYYNAGRVSPGRYTRPVSASPAHHSPHRDGFGYEDASPYHSPAQQQGQEEYYGAGAGPGAGSPYRPVSAPPGPHSPTGHGAWQEQGAMGAAGAGSPYAPDVSEAQHILDMINQADRCAFLGTRPRYSRSRALATSMLVPLWACCESLSGRPLCHARREDT